MVQTSHNFAAEDLIDFSKCYVPMHITAFFHFLSTATKALDKMCGSSEQKPAHRLRENWVVATFRAQACFPSAAILTTASVEDGYIACIISNLNLGQG